MRAWLFLLGGLIVWAAHFLGLYGVASLFPGTALARYLSLGLTAVAVAVVAWLLWRAKRPLRGEDAFTGWMRSFSAAASALALVAILYQAAPALLL